MAESAAPLQLFMDITYKDGRHLTSEEVTGMLVALLFAGQVRCARVCMSACVFGGRAAPSHPHRTPVQHTSSITAAWTALHIAADPDLHARIVAEQRKVMREHPDGLSWDALKGMDLLHRCIKETVRMYPPLIFLMRAVKVPMVSGAAWRRRARMHLWVGERSRARSGLAACALWGRRVTCSVGACRFRRAENRKGDNPGGRHGNGEPWRRDAHARDVP